MSLRSVSLRSSSSLNRVLGIFAGRPVDANAATRVETLRTWINRLSKPTPLVTVYDAKGARLLTMEAYLEKRFNMRPLGVVSKKLIGDRKMAKAILS